MQINKEQLHCDDEQDEEEDYDYEGIYYNSDDGEVNNYPGEVNNYPGETGRFKIDQSIMNEGEEKEKDDYYLELEIICIISDQFEDDDDVEDDDEDDDVEDDDDVCNLWCFTIYEDGFAIILLIFHPIIYAISTNSSR
ncbi:MAG: hypothetical protein EZS28_052859 [Streblomastix strix]|uniref:Uncharacterized protein n=1 Tax=Streblomastix strix TaxID=222440 RepID=A0A5J4RUG2_9EUKA|nr:MAG: hypothetical protein EZS28_052859 [Streblomastix strix]